jgi:hypothetical protein
MLLQPLQFPPKKKIFSSTDETDDCDGRDESAYMSNYKIWWSKKNISFVDRKIEIWAGWIMDTHKTFNTYYNRDISAHNDDLDTCWLYQSKHKLLQDRGLEVCCLVVSSKVVQ